MAQVYQMSADTRDKEKMVGGVMSLNQLMWIVAGVGFYALFAYLTYSQLYILSFIVWLPFIAGGLVLAFKKVNGIPLPRYIVLKIKFKNLIKHYINKTKEKKEIVFSPIER